MSRQPCAGLPETGLTRDGRPCPANAMKKADPDLKHRCPQHCQDPKRRRVVELSRRVGGLITSNQALPEIVERYHTKEDLDHLCDATLNALAARRMKPAIGTAIFAGIATKLKLAELEAVAAVLARLKRRVTGGVA